MLFFTFPEDARWNPERIAVEFGVEIGEYRGVVRVPRRVLQQLLGTRPHRNGASKPITSIDLGSNSCGAEDPATDDGNVEITGRDLRERAATTAESRIGYWRVAP